MKANVITKLITAVCAAFVIAFVSAGCATKTTNWNSRVGSYTYDQAVHDMGPPDKQAKKSEGKTVADWNTSSTGGRSLSIGTGVYHSSAGVGASATTGGSQPVLRLTFGPDGKLLSWSKN